MGSRSHDSRSAHITPFGRKVVAVIAARRAALEDSARRGFISGDALTVRRAVMKRFATYATLGCRDRRDLSSIIADSRADSASARLAYEKVRDRPYKNPKAKARLMTRLRAHAIECCQRTLYARTFYGEICARLPAPKRRKSTRKPHTVGVAHRACK